MQLSIQVANGFRRAVVWLLGFLVICLLLGGLLIVFFPDDIHLLGISGPYPKPFGWLAILVAFIVMALTTPRWVMALPGILVLATLNALLAVITGHLTNSPALLISRLSASILAVLLGASAVLASTLKSRDLNWVDEIALLTVVLALAWGTLDESRAFLSFTVTLFALFCAWLCVRLEFRIKKVPWARRPNC